jgi:hypothetical protein
MKDEVPAGEQPSDTLEFVRTHERLTLLDEAARRIGYTLEVRRTAEELAEVAVPRLADFVAVDLLEGVEEGREPRPGPVGSATRLRRAANRSVTEDAPQATYAVGTLMSFDPATPYAQCLATGQPLLIPTLGAATEWLAQDPKRAANILAAGVHSLMTVPLQARDITLGLAHFYRWTEPGPFEPDDLVLAHDMVARAAVCVDNARRYTGEHRAARTLQDNLLIRDAVTEPSPIATSHRYLPARAHAGVAGDWFDVLPLSGARVGLIIGDVAGRGIEAVGRAGRVRTALRTLAALDLDPDEVLADVDRFISRIADARLAAGDPASETGATCLYAVYDRVTGRCTIASAGHPPPAIVRPGRPAELLDVPVGPPLGLAALPFETLEVTLPDDAGLALYTDGLVRDRHTDPDTGIARLLQALGTGDLTLDELCRRAVEQTVGTHAPEDDAILLLARTRTLAADCVATWDLEPEPAAVRHARALAAGQLAAWGLEQHAPMTELIVSELATNAVRYGRPPIRLRLIRDRSLVCEVSDTCDTAPHLRHATSADEGGRGLFMVAQLAEDWGTRYTPTGKTIWAEQSVAVP